MLILSSKICNKLFASLVLHSSFEMESRKIEHINKRSKNSEKQEYEKKMN